VTLKAKDWFKLFSYQVTEHKVIEIQVSNWTHNPLFGIDLYRVRKNGDHPGLYFALRAFRLELMISIYDRRRKTEPTKVALPESISSESSVESSRDISQ
jgi:hypothetical protein